MLTPIPSQADHEYKHDNHTGRCARCGYTAELHQETPNGKRLCAHADRNGHGMHWLAPGEKCQQ